MTCRDCIWQVSGDLAKTGGKAKAQVSAKRLRKRVRRFKVSFPEEKVGVGMSKSIPV